MMDHDKVDNALRRMEDVFLRIEERIEKVEKEVREERAQAVTRSTVDGLMKDQAAYLERQGDEKNGHLRSTILADAAKEAKNIALELLDARDEQFDARWQENMEDYEEERAEHRAAMIAQWRGRIGLATTVVVFLFAVWSLWSARSNEQELRDARDVVRQLQKLNLQ